MHASPSVLGLSILFLFSYFIPKNLRKLLKNINKGNKKRKKKVEKNSNKI